jgi:hypothetical protein
MDAYISLVCQYQFCKCYDLSVSIENLKLVRSHIMVPCVSEYSERIQIIITFLFCMDEYVWKRICKLCRSIIYIFGFLHLGCIICSSVLPCKFGKCKSNGS